MEKINATVVQKEEKRSIKIEVGDEPIEIPMSEDNPNIVKSAFNKLITRIKNGEFQIELVDVGEDLFSQVAKEYIRQLNMEIHEVYEEMKKHDLVNNE